MYAFQPWQEGGLPWQGMEGQPWQEGSALAGGGSALAGGLPWQWGSALVGGLPWQGVCLGKGVCLPRHAGIWAEPPPFNDRMTDACKNITFAGFATRAVKTSQITTKFFVVFCTSLLRSLVHGTKYLTCQHLLSYQSYRLFIRKYDNTM